MTPNELGGLPRSALKVLSDFNSSAQRGQCTRGCTLSDKLVLPAPRTLLLQVHLANDCMRSLLVVCNSTGGVQGSEKRAAMLLGASRRRKRAMQTSGRCTTFCSAATTLAMSACQSSQGSLRVGSSKN